MAAVAASWRGSSSICPARSWKHDTGRHGMPRRRGTTKRSGCWRRGGPSSSVAEVLAFVPRWVEELAARYNAFGPKALSDQRRRNGRTATMLTQDVLSALSERVRMPPEDGVVWSGRLRLAVWIALRSRAWRRCIRSAAGKRCGRSAGPIQSPRPQHARAAIPAEQATFKGGRAAVAQAKAAHPGRPVEVWARGRAPPRPEAAPAPGLGAGRPAADRPRPSSVPAAARGRLRPADRAARRCASAIGLSKPFFAALLAAFARQTGAGRKRLHRSWCSTMPAGIAS